MPVCMLISLLLVSCFLFYMAYKIYGRFLKNRCGLDDNMKTPACTLEDGVDYVPTRASVLFGHHFSSIAGAGPIVGPVLAAMYFGWVPTWIWIMIGAIFVGGIHDFGSAFLSIRNQGRSIAEISRNFIGTGPARLFLIFVTIALIYVIIVFLDITAANFANDGSIATASGWFVITALVFGYFAIKRGVPFKFLVPIFVPLTYFGLFIGNACPASFGSGISAQEAKNFWIIIILVYCYIAAILPVNVLLQPRDFLSATFLYAMMILGLTGLLFTTESIDISWFEGWHSENANPGYLMPALFITVACGACSGFHSIVSSGTTSKQIRVETDILKVNYGGMLVEGVLAVFALCTIMIFSKAELAGETNAVVIFAKGSSVFLGSLGIPVALAKNFTLLAVSTFLLTTLDTCTRLCRFLFEELSQRRNRYTRYLGTLVVLIIPAIMAFQQIDGSPIWRAVWPMFGATNQLMAALALVTILAFLKARKIRYGFVVFPAIIMVIMPMTALAMMFFNQLQIPGTRSFWIIGVPSLVMFVLGLTVCGISLKFLLKKKVTD